jgi:tellurium resistance protein TerD
MSDAAIVLTKGGRINLSKVPNLKRVRLQLNWKPNTTDTGAQFDLDASAFVCRYDAAGDPKLINNSHFVFYNNSQTPDGAVVHSGDDVTGAQGETVLVDLEKLVNGEDEIAFIVTIDQAEARKQNFGQVSKSSITLYNDETGDCLGGYNLDDAFTNETAVQFGSIYKNPVGSWAFKAIGAGYNFGLAEFVKGYGGTVA